MEDVTFATTVRNPTKQETRKYIENIYDKNKMRFDKCNTYMATVTLGYQGRKSYISAARGATKKEENQRETGEEANL